MHSFCDHHWISHLTSISSGASTYKTLDCPLWFVDLVLRVIHQSLLQAHGRKSSFLCSFLLGRQLMEGMGIIHGCSINDNCHSSDEPEELEDEHG